jgi:cytochrome c peroxidase
VLRVDRILAAGTDAELLRGSRLLRLDDVGNAAGDPAAVAFDRLGNYVVALAGVGEVAIGAGTGEPLHRLAVGRRPTAIALDPQGTKAFIADPSDDAIAVVAVGAAERLGTIRLGPRPEPTPADRGESLFFDARQSHDGWMSCQSCHTDGHTAGLKNDTLGDGSYGAPKQIPSLLGVGSTPPWTWVGGVDRLEVQVRMSIETTMQGRRPSEEQVEDLAAYLRSLEPPPSAPLDDPAVERGRAVFVARECATCHAPPAYTTPERYDVGLVDEVGNRMFNPPSLRGVGLRQPLLHDGRAKTLGDVFATHHHPRDARFSPQEAADLVEFLKTL